MKKIHMEVYMYLVQCLLTIKELHTKFFDNISIITKANVMQQFVEILRIVELLHVYSNFPKVY